MVSGIPAAEKSLLKRFLVTVFVCVRDHLHVDIARDVGLPMAGCARQADESEEDESQDRGYCARIECAVSPASGYGPAGLGTGKRAGRQGELKRVLRGADCDALHATGAFQGANL